MADRKRNDPEEPERRALDEQLKRLVRAEQQLHISQHALGQQLRRVHALNRFAISARWTREPREIFELALELFFTLFPYEQAVGLLATDDGGLVPIAVVAVPGRSAGSRDALARMTEVIRIRLPNGPELGPASTPAADDGEAAPLWRLMDRLYGAVPGDAAGLIVPLAGGDAAPASAIALRRIGYATSFHEQLPREADFAFIDLMRQQIGAALANARLVASLQRSYAELKHAQRELVRRERLAAIGELAALVAHEVRNPLGAIVNSSVLLERAAPATKDVKQLLAIIREESHRIDRIVSDLLDFARPDGISPTEVSLITVVRDAVDSARVEAEKRGVEISLALPETAVARVDAHLMHRALLNLISNATHASSPGGVVVVDLSRDGSAVVIRVSDEGSGIDQHDLERVFEPFFTTRATGTGLGLTVVRRFVDAHGGSVRVSSEPQRGSVFTVRIHSSPVVEAKALGA